MIQTIPYLYEIIDFMKKTFFLFLILAFAQKAHAQSEDPTLLDSLKGYEKLKVGANIKELSAALGLVKVEKFDEEWGENRTHYEFKNLNKSAYSKIFEVKVKTIRIREEEGIVNSVYIEFADSNALQILTNGFAYYLGTDLGCAFAVMDDRYGGCFLTGRKVDFSIQNMDTPLAAYFVRIPE